jgi:peptidoglycan/LPS O-acetylase OafA/YrhL
MLPPLLKIMINEPGLLAEHIEAYSQLIVKDVALWQDSVKRQFKLKAIMGGSLFLTLLFTGIAVMLWGTTNSTHWSLLVIPTIPLLTLIISGMMLLSGHVASNPFQSVKKQFCSDLRMLKEGI